MGALAALTCLLAAAANYVVDPWGLNGFFTADGFNARKPEPLRVARLNKAYGVLKLRPAAVAVGTSTAEHGIDMRHRAWSRSGPAFNLSFPGATISEISTMLQEAHKVSPIRLATIGLDLFSFNAHREPNAQTAEAVDVMRSTLARIMPYFTRGMLGASFNTVLHQASYGPYFLPDGRSDPQAFVQWRVRMRGHHNLFAFACRQTVRGLLALPQRQFEFQRGKERSTLDQFRDLLDFARRSGVELRLFFSPYHVWQYETISAIGLWPSFEYWKQQIAFIVNEYARAASGAPAVSLWDFADYSEFTSEVVPASGDADTRLRWTWDGQHYTVELGNLIQDRMSGIATALPHDYGIKIDAWNVKAHLLAVRARQERYRASHPREVAEVQKIAAETLRSLRSP